MGCALTKDGRVSERDVRLKEGEEPLLMRLGHAEHLPSLDVGSESDVFVVMDLLDAHGHVVASAKWPVKWDNNHPVWNSCRPLGTAPPGGEGMTVRLKLFDHDEDPLGKVQRAELIGTASIALSELRVGEAPSSLPVELKRSKLQKAARRLSSQAAQRLSVRRLSAAGETKPEPQPFITLARVVPEAAPPRKTVYLVRHGESVWNAAQANKDVVAMLSDVDRECRCTLEVLCAHSVTKVYQVTSERWERREDGSWDVQPLVVV